MNAGNLCVVVGAQYGSEGKGAVVRHLANFYEVHVRVGGPNAGHSMVYNQKIWKMQVIPCGWTNPRASLVLGRGMLINPEILEREIIEIEKTGGNIQDRLFIDEMAGVLDPKFHQEEGGTGGELHKRIGSTGEGVGAARVARLKRDPEQFKLVKDALKEYPIFKQFRCKNTPALMQNYMRCGYDVLIEGTQGSGLSLIHGSWPFVTSHDTNASQMLADAGLPPTKVTQVLLVVRTFPIRVAGNSGPLKDEMSWKELSKQVGRNLIEKTTVTGKIRRVGGWDSDLVRNAVTLNAPTSIALTFLDYVSPEDEGMQKWRDLTYKGKEFVKKIEMEFKTPVSLVGTGGPFWSVIGTPGRTL